MPTKGRIQVAPGQTIESANWGNPLWDQSIQCFDTLADANGQYPQASRHVGSMIFTADTSSLYLWIASRWQQISTGAGFDTVAGVPITGVYDGTKPMRRIYRRFNQTTDANGFIDFALANTGIFYMAATVETPNNPPAIMLARATETTNALVRFQARVSTTGAALATAAVVGQQLVVYQT